MTDKKPTQKIALAKLTPDMSRDEKLRNLTTALEKSGAKVLPGRRPKVETTQEHVSRGIEQSITEGLMSPSKTRQEDNN